MPKKIVTIWGGNGQSNLLDWLYQHVWHDLEISSIVSMSDDGRTTGELMRKFQQELGIHLPPPGDLRRCLFMMSGSPKRDEFQQYLETVIEQDFQISELPLEEYFTMVWADTAFLKHISDIGGKNMLDFKLPLDSSIKGHKVGNILMGNLYYNLNKDYNKMLDIMHRLLDVQAHIIPVTTKKAYIKAVLGNGEVIETQDRISNVASYTSGIADLQLMDDSKHAGWHEDVFRAIQDADTIVITPGDLFTSTISNFVIGGVKEVIKKTQAKIVYIGNSTNKWWETQGLTCLDFINKIERFLGRRIDVFICNNKKIELSIEQKEIFQNHISIKWGDFLYLSDGERSELDRRKIQYIEADLLDTETLYKHDKSKIVRTLKQVI